MAVKIKTQKDYLVTEVSLEPPYDLNDIDYLMRASHGTGKIVAVYSDGGVVGINVEQKTRVPESVSQKVRDTVGVGNLNGHSRSH